MKIENQVLVSPEKQNDQILKSLQNIFDFTREAHQFLSDRTNDKQDRGQLQILLLKLNKKIGKKFDSILKNSDLNVQQQSTIQTIVKAAETSLKKESGLKLKEQHTKQNEGWVDWVVSGGKKVVKKGIEVTDTVSNRLSPGWEKDKFNTAIASLQEIASKYAVPKKKIQEEEVQSEWAETKEDGESESNISKGKTEVPPFF